MTDLLEAFSYGVLMFVLLVLVASRVSAGDAAPAPAALMVSISETPDAVLLHIRASGAVKPGSVEVRFVRRKAVVQARDAEGGLIRSEPLRLPKPVVEKGASAVYEADGALMVTLRKEAGAQNAGPGGEPEAVGP